MPSVAACKTAFQAQIAPGDDTGFLRILQEADTRLLETGRWRFCKTTTTLTPAAGLVTLASDHASILGIQIDGWPADIHAQEWEFTPDGIGNIEVGSGGTMLIDQGLNSSGDRIYKISGYLDPTWVINALVLYAPVALADDADLTRCDSLYALKMACFAVVYAEKNSITDSNNYFQQAVGILENQGQNQRGSARQTMSSSPAGRGVRPIRSFR
jgi:hypothetical protein